MKPRISVRSNRAGAVALEFVITSFILLIAIVGIVELSRAIMVNQVLVNAAREGARNAVIPGATNDSFNNVMTHYITSAGIPADSFTVEVFLNQSETASECCGSSHDEVTVVVSVPYKDVSWGFLRYFNTGTVLQSAVVMRKE